MRKREIEERQRIPKLAAAEQKATYERGMYTLEQAAELLAEEQTLGRATLLAQMMAAVAAGQMTVRHPHTELPYVPDPVREFYELVNREDINLWLGSIRAPYRFTGPGAPSAEAEKQALQTPLPPASSTRPVEPGNADPWDAAAKAPAYKAEYDRVSALYEERDKLQFEDRQNGPYRDEKLYKRLAEIRAELDRVMNGVGETPLAKEVEPTSVGRVADPPRVHRIKSRRDILDPAIDKAIEKAGGMDNAAVYLALKELALAGEPPFTGEVEEGALCYTNEGNKPDKIKKRDIGRRLKRRGEGVMTDREVP